MSLDREGIEKFIAAARSNATPDVPWRLPANPYPGLRSFRPKESKVFFGRSRNVEELRGLLDVGRMVVVLGGSGSGKSSVIRAGLMKGLTSIMTVRGRTGAWYAVDFRPLKRPMIEFIGALARVFNADDEDIGDREQIAHAAERLIDPSLGPDPILGEPDEFRLRLYKRFSAALSKETAANRQQRAEALCDALLDFVSEDLNAQDRALRRGIVSGPASLLLVIDQFEEVFRPEVEGDKFSGKLLLLDMVVALHARFLQGDQRALASGLFVAITMRSEELHRCSEHPSLMINGKSVSLADVINDCSYLLDLLDPENDRAELSRAIVEPARLVFQSWSIPFEGERDDAPFEEGVVDWLLRGAALSSASSTGVLHRPDQLPLLQHGLQAMWQKAVEDWAENLGADGFRPALSARHLPGQDDLIDVESGRADLRGCLTLKADEALDQAANAYEGKIETHPPLPRDGEKPTPGHAAMRAMFRALARRDDRGTWARRFATLNEMSAYVEADPATNAEEGGAHSLHLRLQKALQVFVERGYLSLSTTTGSYDLSHEALVRTWKRYQKWLREPEFAAKALVQSVEQLGVDYRKKAPWNLATEISSVTAGALDIALGKMSELPRAWAVEQIKPVLAQSETAGRWEADGSEQTTQIRSDEDLTAFAGRVLPIIAELRNRAQFGRNLAKWMPSLAIVALIALGAAYYSFTKQKYADSQRTIADVQRARAETNSKLAVSNVVLAGLSTSDPTKQVPLNRQAFELDKIFKLASEPDTFSAPLPRAVVESTWENWAISARTALGLTYKDGETTSADKSSYSEVSATCLDSNQSRSDSSGDAFIDAVASPKVPVHLNLAPSQSPAHSQWSIQAGGKDSGMPGAVFAQAIRVCLSPDARLLAVTPPYWPTTIYDLYWTTDGSGNWLVEPIPIGTDPQSYKAYSSVTQPQVSPKTQCIKAFRRNPSLASSDGRWLITYTKTDKADCTGASGSGDATNVIEHYIGIAAPIQLAETDAPAPSPDSRCHKAKSTEASWLCGGNETDDSTAVMLVVVKMNSYYPSLTVWERRLPDKSRWYSTGKVVLPERNVTGKDWVEGVWIGKDDDIFIRTKGKAKDTVMNVWRVFATYETLAAKLATRASEGESQTPTDSYSKFFKEMTRAN